MSEGLLVEGVWKRFSQGYVLRGVSLRLEPGSVAVVEGPNGSGKTTLLRIIAGLTPPSRGLVVAGGGPVSYYPVRPLLYDELTVEENLSYYSVISGLGSRGFEGVEAYWELGVDSYRGRRVGDLSHGWKRRVDLVRALVNSPGVLLVDEPSTGLDAEARRVLARQVARLASKGSVVVVAAPLGDPFPGLLEVEGVEPEVYVLEGGVLRVKAS